MTEIHRLAHRLAACFTQTSVYDSCDHWAVFLSVVVFFTTQRHPGLDKES